MQAGWRSGARGVLSRLSEASLIMVAGALLAMTAQLVLQLLRSVVALPRPGRRASSVAPQAPVLAPPVVQLQPVHEQLRDTRAIHTGPFAAWHYAPYVVYFSSLLFGVNGFFIYWTAQGWLALQLTSSPGALSLLFTVTSFPMLILTLFGGALADRLDRRLTGMATRFVAAGITTVMGLLTIQGVMTIPVFVGLSLLIGIVWSLDIPVRQALVADLVPPQAMANAYSWQSVIQFVGSTIGPVVSGFVVVGAGPGVALIVGAACQGMVGVFLIFVRPTRLGMRTREPVLKRVIGGVKYIGRSEPVLLLLVLATLPSLTAWGAVPLLPIVARDILHGNAGTYGWLTAATGIGSITGAVFVSLSHRIKHKGWLAVSGAALQGVFLALVAYTQETNVAIILLALNGAAAGVAATLQSSLVQVLTPAEYQGRVASIYVLTWNLQPIGIILFGGIAETRGVPFAIWCAGLSMTAAVTLLAITRPALRRLEA